MKYLLPLVPLIVLAGCSSGPSAPGIDDIDIGLAEDLRAKIVATDLNNPSSVSFRPGDGALTIADSGNGRVLVIESGRTRVLIDEMATEYWKKEPQDLYKIGPMATLWLGREGLLVAEGGLPDGQDWLSFYRMRSDSAELDGYSTVIGPTTDDAADLGEGNYIGLCRDGDTIWACCHGNDKKTWIARCNLAERTIEPWISSDDGGVATNSPMQALMWRGNLMVLYSGEGGKEDGLLVEWNTTTKKPLKQWKLKGLVDPMGMAWVEGREQPTLVVTDNNWDLTKVKKGKLALVTLTDTAAEVTVIADNIPGPVNCAFGPDDRLYIACLGSEFDKNKGMVIAVDGID
jgi:hypothetical protein